MSELPPSCPHCGHPRYEIVVGHAEVKCKRCGGVVHVFTESDDESEDES